MLHNDDAQMFMSCHYVGKDMIIKLEKGESWKKVFGPTPIYLNSVTNSENHQKSLWENAKKQVCLDFNSC